ncbi:trace amine-associated receptor 8a-like [Larimichthys crocea]|uniref:trace amine-associated receptor 8a-like n=1 Tax=Larimichthys crocea TaxID=215358 RepID=UPI000F5F559C|nr:trace amine-associated receptor 8a-like [Larimichthys crocea]
MTVVALLGTLLLPWRYRLTGETRPNNLRAATQGKPVTPHFESMLAYILLSFIALLTSALNLLVIISISHFKQLHTPTNLILLSLAFSDFFVGFLMALQIVAIDGCWSLGDILCPFYHFLGYIITSASIGTVVIISIDRYVAICHPLHYSTQITQKRVQVCICLCWICSVIFQGILQNHTMKLQDTNPCSRECMIVVDYDSVLADLIFSFIVPITIIVLLYMRVFVVAISQAHAMRSHIATVTFQKTGKVMAKKSELKAARTLGIVIVVFLLCLCPYYCAALVDEDFLTASNANIIICLVYFNSCLNPLIYALFYPWFRKSIKLIVTLKILQPYSCDANML